MRRWIAWLVPAVVAVVVGSCAGGEALPTSVCRVAEVDLIVVAGAEGDGFFAITGLTVGSDGTAFVLDGGEGSLIAFAPEGDELWRVRGVDAGMEEFGDAAWLHLQRDTLVFQDLAGRRLSFWTEFGEPAGSLELDDLALPGHPSWVASLGDGMVAAAVVEEPLWELIYPEEGVLVVAQGANRLDTIARFPLPEPQLLQLIGHEIPVFPPYAPQVSFAASPDGLIAMARGDSYLVEIFDAEGRLRGEIRGDDTSPPVTAADRRAFGRLLPDTLLVDQVEFPVTHPVITAIAATADRHLLVRTSWTRRDEVRWDRWTLDGEYVESFMLPASMLMVGGVGNLVYGRVEDEVGATSIEVYRTTREATCPGTPANQ